MKTFLTTVATCALLTTAACSHAGGGLANTDAGTGPDDAAPSAASADRADWLVWGKTLSGNRYSTLDSITKQNVAQLRKAWVTPVRDDGEEEAGPIVARGRVYVSTAHDNVLALDGSSGRVQWAFGYKPSYELQYAVNRGVGLAGSSVYIATQDCRLVALDARTGTQRWNVPACHDTSSTWYSMATYVFDGTVYLGTSGGDLGGSGLISAFRAADGSRLWDWHTVAQPGDPNHHTWPGQSWVHGGAAVWAGLSIDPATRTLYATPGNAGPNLTLNGRKGLDLYSNSVVALSIAGERPKLRWYHQILPYDTHDADPAMPPVLFEGRVRGATRKLLATADKAGDFLILDRTTGKVLTQIAVSTQTNLRSVPTLRGTFACPNHGGGVEWNGGAYDPATNAFIVPSTQECATWKVTTTGPVAYVPGQPYSAGPLPKRRPATGVLTAVDVDGGRIRWRVPLPYPAQGGVSILSSGVAFTSDVRGRVYAFDTSGGRELWHDDTGSQIVAPAAVYEAGGKPYVVVEAGEAGNQTTPNLPRTQGARVVAYALGVTRTATNTLGGQPAVALAGPERTESSAGRSGGGGVPYTPAQVAVGKAVYGTACSSCHGARLQGVSAPALSGPSFGHANLNVSQVRAIVTQQMPLSAPGTLRPDQYAAVMAYLSAYDCHPAAGGRPFPTADRPEFKRIAFGGASCPVK